MERQWMRVSRAEPCKVCGKPDYCTRSGGLVLCMRVESLRPSGCKLGGWLHSIDDAIPNPATLPKQPKPEINWTELSRTMFSAPNASEERNYLAQTLGVKESALIELRVGRGWDEYRDLPYSSWPERAPDGKVVGIIRRYRDGSKKTMRWSSHGLYYGENYLRMKHGPVYLPEGGSDTAALLGLGLNVIGRPSNMGGVKQLAELLSGCRNEIVVIGEMDKKAVGCEAGCGQCLRCWPGLAGAKETAKRLAAKLNRRVRWVIPNEKDVRAWLLKNPTVTGPGFLRVAKAWSRS